MRQCNFLLAYLPKSKEGLLANPHAAGLFLVKANLYFSFSFSFIMLLFGVNLCVQTYLEQILNLQSGMGKLHQSNISTRVLLHNISPKSTVNQAAIKWKRHIYLIRKTDPFSQSGFVN